jgi:hypothetical protein
MPSKASRSQQESDRPLLSGTDDDSTHTTNNALLLGIFAALYCLIESSEEHLIHQIRGEAIQIQWGGCDDFIRVRQK